MKAKYTKDYTFIKYGKTLLITVELKKEEITINGYCKEDKDVIFNKTIKTFYNNSIKLSVKINNIVNIFKDILESNVTNTKEEFFLINEGFIKNT